MAASGGGAATAVGFDASDAERRDCGGGREVGLRKRGHCHGFDQPGGIFRGGGAQAGRRYGCGARESEPVKHVVGAERDSSCLKFLVVSCWWEMEELMTAASCRYVLVEEQ